MEQFLRRIICGNVWVGTVAVVAFHSLNRPVASPRLSISLSLLSFGLTRTFHACYPLLSDTRTNPTLVTLAHSTRILSLIAPTNPAFGSSCRCNASPPRRSVTYHLRLSPPSILLPQVVRLPDAAFLDLSAPVCCPFASSLDSLILFSAAFLPLDVSPDVCLFICLAFAKPPP